MVKQLLLPIAAVAIFIVLVGIFTQKSPTLDWSKYLQPSASSQVKTMTVGTKTIQVEIANTRDLRTKGLSGVTSLPKDNGMLFVFESKKATPTFWMKDMLIPLDIIWIANGKVVKLDKNVAAPASDAKDGSLIKYSSPQAVDYVLEVNSGFSDTNNIKVNDSVILPAGS